ncbi:MAG: bifunctional diaminohydroxyphosphoribosylaminopyrimidine deaminase/5-amino-6-(5-phosphoribosylamino)uracil reductase RibD [Gammaproteobacteria bacterium]
MTESSFMLEAFELAKKGQFTVQNGACVGCVISKDNKILGQGWYEYYGAPHAEIRAIESVIEKYKNNYEEVLSDSTLTVTLEPCSTFGKTPPCLDEILKHNFKKVIIGALDPSQSSVKKLKAAGIEVSLEEVSNDFNNGFFSSLLHKRPYVRAKIAMSEDQKISFIKDDQQWITSEESREDSQQYRALSDLILTGSGTIERDNPLLNVRNKEITKLKGFQQPARGIITSSKLESSLNFFSMAGKKYIFCKDKNIFENFQQNEEVSILEIENTENNKINLKELLKKIHSLKFNDILLESGPTLITSFINEDLIDEFIIYIAPKMLSNTALSFFNGDESKSPFHSKQFKLIEESTIKEDKKLIFKRI